MENVNCELCGKDVPRTGNNQCYCPDCARKLKMQREREIGREKQKTKKNTAAAKLTLNRLREAVPDKAPKGWSLRGKSADRITIEARALGLSYGQYTAACMGGNIISLLRSMGIRNGEKLINKAWEEHCRNRRGA